MRIGIDPGLTGAIAVLDDDERPIQVFDMPVMAQGVRGNEVNVAALSRMLLVYPDNTPVVLEKVHSMPRQGVASSFRFGESFGAVKGVVGALQMPLVLVTPQEWKKRAGLIGKNKDLCRAMCVQQFPHLACMLENKSDCGRADAIMIAKHWK